MTIIYAISSGSYSDYGVIAIFSTKEKAQEYMKISNEYRGYGSGDFNDIEEYDLDPVPKIPHNHKFKYFYYGKIDKEGNILHCNQTMLDIMNPDSEKEYYKFYYDHDFDIHSPRYNQQYIVLVCNINANSKDHAIKIMGEKRTKLLAENRWLDDPTQIKRVYMDVTI